MDKGTKKLDSRSAEQSGHLDVVQQVQPPHEYQTSDESSDEEESLLSYQKNSNVAIMLENARLIIDTLYKLSFKIRDPATRVGFSKARAYRQVDEDTGGDQNSNVANIDDQNSMSSKSGFEKRDKDDMHENETKENMEASDSKTFGDAVSLDKIVQETIQRFEHGLQQRSNSTEKGIDLNAFSTTVRPDSAPYRGESNNKYPASVISPLSGGSLSFYVQIEAIEPNYQAQPIRHGPYWAPPNIRTGFTRRAVHFFRWFGGVMTTVAASDPVIGSIHHVFSAATIFTQNPDTPHLLIVPFDAQRTHAYQNKGGWKPLYFNHVRIDNTQRTYSAVSAVGDRQYIAASGSPHWMPQLLPKVYDFQTGSPRIQAGLIGSIPLLIALAAFSAPPPALAAVLTSCLRPGTWRPHQYQYPAGRKFRRSMVFHQLIETRHCRERHGRHHFCRSSESSRI